LGIAYAGTLPLPTPAFDDFEPLFDPGAQPIPAGFPDTGSQIGQ
jgi:hypothetical protein